MSDSQDSICRALSNDAVNPIAAIHSFSLLFHADCGSKGWEFRLTRNTKFGIVSSLSLHPDAANDLRALMVSDQAAAGKIAAFLQQAKSDPKIIASLTDHDFGNTGRELYHVSKWFEYWNAGLNLWRVKLWIPPKSSLKYRIVYAYQPSTQHHHVLAIVNRDFDYDPNHAVTQRILLAYHSIGITTRH